MMKRILDAVWNVALAIYILIIPMILVIAVKYYDTHPTVGHVLNDAELLSKVITAFGIFIIPLTAGAILIFIKNMVLLYRSSSKLLSEARLLVMNSNIGIKYRGNINVLKNVRIAPIFSLSVAGNVSPDELNVINLNVVLNPSRRALVTVLAHEMVHILQCAHYRDMFEMYAHFNKRIGYWNNPLEVEAHSVRPMNRRKMILSGNRLIKAQDMIINYLRD
jgi:hypothetical protein